MKFKFISCFRFLDQQYLCEDLDELTKLSSTGGQISLDVLQ